MNIISLLMMDLIVLMNYQFFCFLNDNLLEVKVDEIVANKVFKLKLPVPIALIPMLNLRLIMFILIL